MCFNKIEAYSLEDLHVAAYKGRFSRVSDRRLTVRSKRASGFPGTNSNPVHAVKFKLRQEL